MRGGRRARPAAYTHANRSVDSGEPVDEIVRSESSRCETRGSRPTLAHSSRYLALVPNIVTRSASMTSHSAVGPGWNGDPSYETTVAPVASALTTQFHIIQPVVVNWNTTSPRRMSLWRRCSLRCLSSTPPARWTIAFGLPVVPDENSTYHGWSYGNSSNSVHGVARPSQSSHAIHTPSAAVVGAAAIITPRRTPSRSASAVALATVSCRLPAYECAPVVTSTAGSSWPNRSTSASSPKSGDALANVAPTAAVARPMTTDSMEYGTTATTRSPGRTPSASSAPAAARTASDSSWRVSTRRVPSSLIDDQRVALGRFAEQHARDVQAAVREERRRRRHVTADVAERTAVRTEAAQIPHRRPERSRIVDRPAVQDVSVRRRLGRRAVLFDCAGSESRPVAGRDPLRRRRPDDVSAGDHAGGRRFSWRPGAPPTPAGPRAACRCA